MVKMSRNMKVESDKTDHIAMHKGLALTLSASEALIALGSELCFEALALTPLRTMDF